jgi:uncharacterized membrane protein YcaP (DUF421 family)
MGTIIRAIAGYLFLILVLRNLGRRPGAQMTASEFVLIFLMGGVVILTTMGSDRSVTNSFCAVITVGALHWVVSYLKQRFPRIGAIVDGPPIVLLKNGQWQTEAMQKLLLQDDDVMAAARSKGAKTLGDIKYAILERNGAISIIRNS